LLASNFLDPGARVEVPDVVGMDVDRATRILEDEGLAVDTEERASRKPEGEVLEQDPEAGETAREGDTVTLTVSEGLPDVEVPDLEGMTVAEAREELEEARLRLGDQTQQPDEDVPEGEIIDQTPDAGSEIEARSRVDVVVSSGPAAVTVPGVVGMPESEAVAEIQDADLRVEITRGPSDDYDEGIVAGQDPDEGTEVDAGSTVVIFVSEGAEERPMPDVTGQDADEAEANLESDYGLNVSQRAADPGDCGAQPPGTVCSQDPEPGTPVAPGDSAVLFVLGGGAAHPGEGGFYALLTGLLFFA
jgi:serine/threonine-protein kinase